MYSRCIKKQLVVKAKAKTSFKQLFTRCLALPGGYKRKTVWQLDKTPVLCVRLWEGEMAMCVGQREGLLYQLPGAGEREAPDYRNCPNSDRTKEAPLSSSSPAPGPPSSRERGHQPPALPQSPFSLTPLFPRLHFSPLDCTSLPESWSFPPPSQDLFVQ